MNGPDPIETGCAAPVALPLRVLLLEDDAPTRARLAASLRTESRFDVVEAGTLAEARGHIAAAMPAVLLADLQLPDGDGETLIREVRQASAATEILVISVLCDERKVVAAIAAGATGYLQKDALPEDIAATVWQVLRGESPVSSGVARHILRQLGTGLPEKPPDAAVLTQRETDILWGVAKGLTYHEIADALGVSRKTVPNYIKSIYRKLAVGNRGEAVYEAVRQRLIRL